MARLTVDEIRNAKDCPTKEIDVPEWGGSVLIGRVTLKQRDAIFREANGADGKPDGAKLIRLFVEHGVIEPKLTQADLEEKAAAVLDRLATEISEHNGWGKGAATVQDATFRPAS